MRSLVKVINEMLAVIPESEKDLRYELGKTSASVAFTAPEHIGERWREVEHALGLYIGKPKLVWHMKVQDIFLDDHPVNRLLVNECETGGDCLILLSGRVRKFIEPDLRELDEKHNTRSRFLYDGENHPPLAAVIV